MARKMMNGIDLQSQRAVNAADASNPTDLVTKQQLDAAVAGLSWKQPVRVATTTNGTLATAFASGQTIDGVTLATSDRILLKDQTTQSQNGIYIVQSSGSPVRATDADSTAELQSATVYVTSGTTNADKAYTQTTDSPTIGSSNIVWAQVGGGTLPTAGNGLTLTGSTLDVGAGTGISVGADTVSIDTSIVPRKYAASIGNGSLTSIAVTHNLGTRDVGVTCYDNSTFEEVLPDVTHTDTNNVTIVFATAPTSNQYRVVVMG
ncbi:hypothetical protein GCM10023196_035730 [Actinoallomurus vinaceus]|uniref:Uncharacterized protein n=1 Tax=Actinoallomurus vinaceus TaxID=1080074 RepID=A0ABP8UC68_9ACTN